jgi:hypothetical protein
MMTMAAVLGGCLVGLLLARGRAPEFHWRPYLLGVAALLVLLSGLAVQKDAFMNSWLVLVSALVVSAASTAYVWRQRMPELRISFGGWMWRAFFRPRYVRDLCREVEEERRRSTS